MLNRLKSMTRLSGIALAAGLLTQTMLAGIAHAQDREALMKEHRGGTMVLTAVSAAGTVDPMIN